MTNLIIPSRRGFLTGLGAALITAPAIVHAGNLMPVKVVDWWDASPAYFYGSSLSHRICEFMVQQADKEREEMLLCMRSGINRDPVHWWKTR